MSAKILVSYPALIFYAVSYTHLDVYKRQNMKCRRRCFGKSENVSMRIIFR